MIINVNQFFVQNLSLLLLRIVLIAVFTKICLSRSIRLYFFKVLDEYIISIKLFQKLCQNDLQWLDYGLFLFFLTNYTFSKFFTKCMIQFIKSKCKLVFKFFFSILRLWVFNEDLKSLISFSLFTMMKWTAS